MSRQVGVGSSLLLSLILLGCSEEPGAQNAAGTEVSLRGTVFSESEAFGQPGDLAVVGEHLVLLDGLGNPAIHAIRLEDGSLARSFGRKGEGPGEFSGVRSIDPVPGSASEFWVFDISLRRLTHVDLAGTHISTATGQGSLTFRAGELPMSPAWIGGEIVSPGILAAGRLARYDSVGNRVATTGSVPAIVGREVPVTVLQHAFTGTLAANPSRTRLALGTRHSDRLEIYRADGAPVATVRSAAPFEPAFQVQALNGIPHMASGDDMRFGYVDVQTTEDRIFALFSGRTRRDYPGRAVFAEYVHEYDWDGRLRRVLKLDADVLSIAVDAEGKKLFATRWTPTPAVLVYPL